MGGDERVGIAGEVLGYVGGGGRCYSVGFWDTNCVFAKKKKTIRMPWFKSPPLRKLGWRWDGFCEQANYLFYLVQKTSGPFPFSYPPSRKKETF